MTVVSTLDLRLKPDGVEESLQLLGQVLADTRRRPGCLSVEVVQDVTDPVHVTAIERWESLADDDAYRAWRRSPEGASPLGSVLSEAPVLTRYEVTSI